MSSVAGAAGPRKLVRTMRAAIIGLLAGLSGGACSGPDEFQVEFIADFRARSPLLTCESLPHLDREQLVVEDLARLGDEGILVTSGQPGALLVLDESARILRRVELPREGPGAVGSPVSSTPLGDSSLLVADAGRMLLKRLGPSGDDRGTVRTGFSPLRVRRSGDRTFVIPGVVGGYPDRLLYRLDGDSLVAGSLPLRRYPGMTHGSFANRMGAAPLSDGRLLLLHGFYIPEAYIWSRGGVRRFSVPVPDDLQPHFRDRRPVEVEADLAHIPVVGLSPFVDPHTGSITYLTRSGGRLGPDSWEKALVQVDSAVQYQASGLLPVDALLATRLGPDSVLVVSAEGRWHRCARP